MMLRTSPPFLIVGKKVLCKHRRYASNADRVYQVMRLWYCEARTSGDSIPRNCSQLSSLSPAAKCQYDDGPCHQECSKPHADGEEKHGHQIEILHIPDNVPCLQNGVSKYYTGEDNKLTYTSHEDETTRDKAER